MICRGGRGPEAAMPVERDADEYNMCHSRRGRAIIINNDIFDNNLVNPRKGSDVDVENLKTEFTNLGFEVTVFCNMTFYQISEAINESKFCRRKKKGRHKIFKNIFYESIIIF